MPRKTKIGTEVAHVTRDSDTTFKIIRSQVNSQGAGAYCGGLPHRLLDLLQAGTVFIFHVCDHLLIGMSSTALVCVTFLFTC